MLVVVGLLIAWQIVSPIKCDEVELPGNNETFMQCVDGAWRTKEDTSSTVLPIAISMIFLLVTIGIYILAYKVRNINQEIGDSGRICRYFALMTFTSGLYDGFQNRLMYVVIPGVEASVK